MGIKNTLSAYFLKSIITICFMGLLIFALNMLFLVWGINQHFLLVANAPIKIAEEIKSEIVKRDTIDKSVIPSELDYAIFNKQTGKLVETNLNSRNAQKAEKVFFNTSNDKPNSFIKYDSLNETLLIYYNLKVQFADAQLRRNFPNPGVALAIFSAFIYLIYFIWKIKRFSHIIIEENKKLINVTNKIKEKDLNFEFPKVRFNEYKDVMEAMESLSAALVKSIKKEIKITNAKAEQINYLVHDIKIPLTIIKGNVELLESTNANTDTEENFTDILNSIEQIERYIQEVIDINLNNKRLHIVKEKLSIDDFLGMLEVEFKGLGSNVLLENYTKKTTEILVDVRLFIRAINNIVLNGIERTPKDKKVKIIVTQSQESIEFSIIDHGPGFSDESLNRAMELFYTDNEGRTNNNHYGLGLPFTEKVIKQHDGRITLKNTAQHSGEVLVEIPILKEASVELI